MLVYVVAVKVAREKKKSMVPVEAACLKLQNVKHVEIGKSRKSLKQQGSLQKYEQQLI